MTKGEDGNMEDPKVFSEEKMKELKLGIILLGWDKRRSGEVKRKWLLAFNAEERRRLSEYIVKIRTWETEVGYPEQYRFISLDNLAMIKRAVRFFGNI